MSGGSGTGPERTGPGSGRGGVGADGAGVARAPGGPAAPVEARGSRAVARAGERSAETRGGDLPEGRFLVVIPTYNEIDNLPRIVPRVLEQDERVDVLVVDDNSPDGTGQAAAALAEGSERVYVLRRSGKQGLGRAYVAGFLWGLQRGYGLLFEMDADFSHDPDSLPTFIEEARHHDVVLGSRYVGGRVTVVNWPMSRLLISYFGSWYARTITGLPVRDATGGYNCWRHDVLATLDLNRIQSNGYAFQIELKYRAWRRGFRIKEIPIVFAERDSGESKMSKRIVREAVWRVWKLRLMALLGRL